MTTQLFYFTGTGNGLHIAKTIKGSLDNNNHAVELIPINTLDLKSNINSEANIVGIIYPTYAMSAPDIVKIFAEKLHANNDAYVFTYAHCGGGGSAGAIAIISDILTNRGIVVSNTFETIFPSNSTLFKYTDEKLKSVLKKSEVSIEKNIKMIGNKVENIWKGSGILKKASLKMNGLFSKALEGYMQFDVIEPDDKCIGCGVCSKVCPVENIEMNGKPNFKTKCEMCLSCVNNCPKQALAFKKMNRETFRPYRHPEVQIKELMYR